MTKKTETPPSYQTWVLFLIALAVVFRLLSWSGRTAIQTDSVTYISCGVNLFKGEGLVDTSGHALVSKPPLYPFLIGLVWKLGLDGETAARFVSFLSGLGVVILLFLLSRKLHGSGISLVVLAFASVFPGLVNSSTAALAESTTLLFLVSGTYFLLPLLEDWKLRDLILSATPFSLSVWTRSNAVLIVLSVIPVILAQVFAHRGCSRTKKMKSALWFMLWVVLLLQPLMAWNFHLTGRWTLSPESSSWFRVMLESETGDEARMEETLSGLGNRSEPEMSTLELIQSEPARFLQHSMKNAYTFYKETLPTVVPPLFFFLAGMGFLLQPVGGFSRLTVLLPFFLPLPLWMLMRGGEPRDVIPLIPPILILSGAGAVHLWRWARDLDRRKRGARHWGARAFAGTLWILTLGFCLPGALRYPLGVPGQAVEQKEMGRWILKNFPEEDRIILTRKPMVAFYAEGRAESLVYGDLNDLREGLEKTHARFLAIDSRTTAKIYPQFAPLFDGGNPPGWLHLLHRVEAPDGEWLILYEVRH